MRGMLRHIVRTYLWHSHHSGVLTMAKARCPHTGQYVGECECAFTDSTSPFFALRRAHETNDAALKILALRRIGELECKEASTHGD